MPATRAPEKTIDRDELRAMLERGDALKLVMAGSDWAFRTKHIRGSLHFDIHQPTHLFDVLAHDDDIVVYCSNVDCNASHAVIKKLLERGYSRLTHYRGGLIDWEEAGWPLDGDWAESGR